MYVLLRRLHLLNTLWAMFLPAACNTFYLMLVKNYITSLSPELEEAARIDGCNDIVILVRIIIPVTSDRSKPSTICTGTGRMVYAHMPRMLLVNIPLSPR